ncbi:MAG TPA: hypothetical protein PLF01_06530, partial [Alphaproteobacteria bacterium]|nr:hypothetical protein [Alphaproteobacteria bacterium]
MPRITQVKTNFTAGEVSSDLLGRGDLRAYENGAALLRNLFIYPTGGITRRAGLQYIDTAEGNGRLIPFEFNTEQTYLLVLTSNQIDVYLDDVHVTSLASPWPENDIAQLAWTQSADTLLLVHPDYAPKKLIRNALGNFELNDWAYFEENGVNYQPFYKFADSSVTLTPSGTTGTITLTASSDVFFAAHAGTRLQISGKQVDIISYDSPTVVTVNVIEDLADTSETIDWFEQAFSPVRGYPVTVAFHQDRLVIGGSRDLPNRLWFSRSGDLFNFDLGTGLDDEAIEFSILSDQVNAIRGIFSGRHLQVFTSGAEWMVTGVPLTPATVQLNRQTRVGSAISRYIPPVTVDGATVFIARNDQGIREFLYTDIEQAYTAVDLALASRHIAENIIDQDYDPLRRLIFAVREDGKFATMTFYRAEQVRAWTLHETQGAVKSVSVVGDDVYMLVDRNDNYLIEKFNEDLNLDSVLTGEVTVATDTWSGLDHLDGLMVSVIADGVALDNPVMVTSGAITLDDPANKIEVGLPYTHIIEPLPPAMIEGIAGKKLRLVRAVYRLQQTQAMRLDTGQGLKDIPLKQFGEDVILDAPPPVVDGDIAIRALGWQKGGTSPLWRIEQSVPYPF